MNTSKICLESLLCCNQSQARSSYHRNHRQRTVSHCLISYREGLGTSLCIMGYGTQHTHSQKEHTELNNILKFGVNQANIRKDTAIQKLQILLRNVWNTGRDVICPAFHTFLSKFFKFLNGCISPNISLINTKLEDVVKFDVLFLWVLSPISHNTQTCTQTPTV